MTDIIYHLLVIAIAAFGLLKGFRRRFTRQIPSFIGFAVGAICCYVFREPVVEWFASTFPSLNSGIDGSFVVSTLSCSAIYIAVYNVFRFATAPITLIYRYRESGMFDNIAGSFYGMIRYTVWISLLLNLIVCIVPDSRLLKYARSDDGDIVHEVMLLSPAVTGSESVDDLAHRIQLDEASRIS